MRVLDGDQFLVRIFFGESDKWHTRRWPAQSWSDSEPKASRERPSCTASRALAPAV